MVTFWAENESYYPLLGSLAIDMLCIPASLAPVERTFPQLGNLFAGEGTGYLTNLERGVSL